MSLKDCCCCQEYDKQLEKTLDEVDALTNKLAAAEKVVEAVRWYWGQEWRYAPENTKDALRAYDAAKEKP